MDKNEAKELFEKVKENHNKLDKCELHNFSIDMTPDKVWGKKYQCENCGGEVDSITKNWYEKGLKHGRGEQNV